MVGSKNYDLTNMVEVVDMLQEYQPDAVIHLAGENRPKDPTLFDRVKFAFSKILLVANGTFSAVKVKTFAPFIYRFLFPFSYIISPLLIFPT